MRFQIACCVLLWLFQIGCVIAGTLEWWVLFGVPAAFAIGGLAAHLYWRLNR